MDWPRTILVFLAILVTQCSNHMVRCKITDVRLVGGPSSNKGTVELRQDSGTWETTCGTNLGISDVIVICRQSGFTGASRAIPNTPYGQNSTPTKGLQCNNGVVELSECTVFTSPSCSAAGAASCHGEGYLGCFVDSTTDRVLPGDNFIKDPSMTISKCIQFCIESTTAIYIYAGVVFGEQCFCGEAGVNYARLGIGTDSGCQSPCSGESTESCGGTGYIAVFSIHVETSKTTPDIVSTERTAEVTTPVITSITSSIQDIMTTSPMTIVLPPTLQPRGHSSCLGVAVGEGIVIILLIIVLLVYILRNRAKQRESNHGQDTHDMTFVKKSSSNDKDSSFYHGIQDVNPQASTLTSHGDTQYSARIYCQKGGHAVDINDMKREETGKDADPYIEII